MEGGQPFAGSTYMVTRLVVEAAYIAFDLSQRSYLELTRRTYANSSLRVLIEIEKRRENPR